MLRSRDWTGPGVHFLLSMAIAGAAVALMLIAWYPWPLFMADGRAARAVGTLLTAALLGPLGIFFLFRSRPHKRRFDLLVVVTLQLLVLILAVRAVHLLRPVFIVFTLDRFDLVAAKDLDALDLAQAKHSQFKTLPLGGPLYVAAVPPSDPAEQQKIMFDSLGGRDLNLYPQHYVAYGEQVRNALARAQGLGVLLERDRKAVEKSLESSGRAQDGVRFLPLRARRMDGAVLLDSMTGLPLAILLIDPW